MKKILATLIFSTLLLSACDPSVFQKVGKEAGEAAQNLATEAAEIKESVEEKVEDLQYAADSIKDASEAFGQAKESLKDLTGKDE
jgi:peptidoglycan hydrolase CwlO-like protein